MVIFRFSKPPFLECNDNLESFSGILSRFFFLQKKLVSFGIHGSNRRIEIPFSIDKSMGCHRKSTCLVDFLGYVDIHL